MAQEFSASGMREEDPFDNTESRARYAAYSKLQASAVAFGEKLPIPEIVAIGGQSDGKSSLLEALLGFRFNIREVEMGTRRPLMVQMSHDPTALEPRCRLQEEDSDEYGPPISPASAVAEAIKGRTDKHLNQLKAAVSSKPIVMRAEYAFCPNLTIIDTPGFILQARRGEQEDTPEAILEMVKDLAAAPNRLLLFLQQSSVEWCSSLWLKVAQEVDPTLQRTVIVASKFDNRLKEFSERWEVDRYLSASGFLGENVSPFFVALPKGDKHAFQESAAEFRKQIAATDKQVFQALKENVAGGYDEERFGTRIGFGNLRRFLEKELQRRYRDSAPATLALLDRRCSEVSSDLVRAGARLSSAADVAALRRDAMAHAAGLARHVSAMLEGPAAAEGPDPADWGRTSEEERKAVWGAGAGWPGVGSAVQPANARLRLYGGAAFARVLDEFRCAACSLDCPPLSKEKVANVLLSQRAGSSSAALASVGSELGRAAARAWVAPLLDAACDRLADVIRVLFELADLCTEEEESAELAPYVAYHAALRTAFDKFVSEIAAHCKSLARHHLSTATSPYATFCDSDPGSLNIPGAYFSDYPNLNSQQPDQDLDEEDEDQQTQKVKVKIQEHNEEENIAPETGRRSRLASPAGSREPLRESQMTVPETPSPEQVADVAALRKKREYAVASGRFGGAKDPPGGAGEGSPARKKPVNRTASREKKERLSSSLGGQAKGPYADVCRAATEQFSRVREIVVHQLVPATLNAGFLTPCRERLGTSIAVELFARCDADFMDMFVAPGAVETLQAEKDKLEKKVEMLIKCKDEFRALAREL